MPLDPNIILGVQQPKFDNPLDVMGKAMAYKSLVTRNQTEGLQAQQAQQEFNDNQALRTATENNIKVGPDGSRTLDQKGMLDELGTTSPSLVPKVALQQHALVIEAQNQAIANKAKQFEMSGQLAGSVKDQATLDSAHQAAQAMGLDTSMIPTTYDPNSTPSLMAGIQKRALSAKDQAENQLKQQDMGIKEKELNLSLQKNQAEQVQQTLGALQSARGNKAVQQAESDIYAGAKVNTLVNQAKDKNGNLNPNLLNMTKVRLIAMETGKIATGGAPTMDETHGLTPGGVPQWLSEAAEKVHNSPTPANAGAFVKQLQQYSNGVVEDAKGVVRTNYQGILETKKPWLPPGAYDTMNQQFIGRLNGDVAPGSEWGLTKSGGKSGSGSKGDDSAPAIHPALQGKSIAELQAMKAAMLNANK